MSILYGGIHYKAAIDIGLKQGCGLGAFVVDNLEMYSSNTKKVNKCKI